MRKAVFNGFRKIILLSVLICTLLFTCVFTQYMKVWTGNNLEYSLYFIEYMLDFDSDVQQQIDDIKQQLPEKNTRITVTDCNGVVAADTDTQAENADNHLSREEIQQALHQGMGTAVRNSQTLGQTLFYAAKKTADGNYIIRLSVPYNGFKVFMTALIPAMVLALLIAFVVAHCFANKISKTVTEPLEEISRELVKIQNTHGELIYFGRYEYDELNNVCQTAEVLSQQIAKNQEKLLREKNKISYILDNMSEGIILIDSKKQIATINKAALKILDSQTKEPNKNILFYTRQNRIVEGVSAAIENNTPSFFDIKKDGKIFSVHITQVNEGFMKNAGAIVLLIDVTDERENQRIRQEFFSNASHELKTPLTSIMGYSELLCADISMDNQKEFLRRIRLEAENMASLINDILMISRLEAGTEVEEISQIQIKPMVDEIVKTFEPQIIENNIDIFVKCEDITTEGIYARFYQLINNLISNAVKYNMQNGKISVDCFEENNKFKIIVSNTGTPIPIQYQKRVFERFFRVDKGRSKRVKGTGLGLSIVKHIVDSAGGSIKLKSDENLTTFMAEMPLN